MERNNEKRSMQPRGNMIMGRENEMGDREKEIERRVGESVVNYWTSAWNRPNGCIPQANRLNL